MKDIYTFYYTCGPSEDHMSFLFSADELTNDVINNAIDHCISRILDDYNKDKDLENRCREYEGDNFVEYGTSLEEARDRKINFLNEHRHAIIDDHRSKYINYNQAGVLKEDIIEL